MTGCSASRRIRRTLSALAASCAVCVPHSTSAHDADAGETFRADCDVPGAEAVTCPSLVDLGHLAGIPGFDALRISADGSTIIGTLAGEPTRLVDGEPRGFGPPPPGARIGKLVDVSADGSVVIGQLWYGLEAEHPNVAFRWEGGAFEVLPPSVGGAPAEVTALSDDGNVIVGGTAGWGFRWERGLPERSVSGFWTFALSGDGRITGGALWNPGFWMMPAIWTGGDPEFVVEENRVGEVNAIDADGSVLVGYTRPPNTLSGPNRATRWVDDSLELLEDAGDLDRTEALAVSADGRAVAGVGFDGEKNHALWWNGDAQARRLHDLLAELGVDLGDYETARLTGISADGRIAVGDGGRGITLFGAHHGFAATVTAPVAIDVLPGFANNPVLPDSPRPLSVAVFGSRLLDVGEVDAASVTFGPDAATPLRELSRDINRDGYRDRLFFFRSNALGLGPEDEEACLRGRALELPFVVCAPVTVLPACGRGYALALVVPPILLGQRRVRGKSRTPRGSRAPQRPQ